MNGQSDGLGSVNHVATLALSLLLALLGYFAKGMYDRQIDHDRQIVSLIEDQKAHELRDATSEKTLENVRTIQAGVIASLEALKGTNSDRRADHGIASGADRRGARTRHRMQRPRKAAERRRSATREARLRDQRPLAGSSPCFTPRPVRAGRGAFLRLGGTLATLRSSPKS